MQLWSAITSLEYWFVALDFSYNDSVLLCVDSYPPAHYTEFFVFVSFKALWVCFFLFVCFWSFGVFLLLFG